MKKYLALVSCILAIVAGYERITIQRLEHDLAGMQSDLDSLLNGIDEILFERQELREMLVALQGADGDSNGAIVDSIEDQEVPNTTTPFDKASGTYVFDPEQLIASQNINVEDQVMLDYSEFVEQLNIDESAKQNIIAELIEAKKMSQALNSSRFELAPGKDRLQLKDDFDLEYALEFTPVRVMSRLLDPAEFKQFLEFELNRLGGPSTAVSIVEAEVKRITGNYADQ